MSAESSGKARSAASASVARQGSIGMGIAIASLIAFLVIAVGAFWAINGDAMTASGSRSPGATTQIREASPGPGQIGTMAERKMQKSN